MSYVYIKSEPTLWTVGFYGPQEKWVPESDHDSAESAEKRVVYLNGGNAERDEKDAKLQAIGECAAKSLAEMVAALECDYDRLEELRDRNEVTEHTADDCPGKPCSTDCDHKEFALDYDEREELAELESAAGDCESREDAEQRIHEDPLSIEVRSDWHSPGESGTPDEFCILLGTGGPAIRIIGELNQYNEPLRARLQAQDWFTVWTDYRGDAISDDDLLTYCRCFYFGEG